LHQGKKNWRKCICSGGACIRAFGSSFHLNFSCVRLPMVTSPFASPWGVSNLWSILSRLCRVVALALGYHIFLTQVIFSWLLFSFWSFVWVFRLFIFFFFFLWISYLCVLSMRSSMGRLRTRASEDRLMVTPGCGEWLTTWCDWLLAE
jgi:hypothetical protein